MSCIATVRAHVRDSYKVPSDSAGKENGRLNRALCEVLRSLRGERTSFNRSTFSLTTVASQATYGRANKEGGATLLPYDFWGVLGRDLYLDQGSGDTRTIRPLGDRRVRALHNSLSGIDTGPPTRWTSENRKLDFFPTPAAAYTVSGAYHQDLGTPVPRYISSARTYSAVQALQYDDSGASFVDVLSNLLNPGASAQAFPAGSGASDRFYMAWEEVPRTPLTIVVGTAGVGTYTGTWKYWNGYAWVAFSGVTDNTSALQTVGSNTLVFTNPSDWAPKVLNSGDRNYFITLERDGGTVTTDPTVTSATWTGGDTWEYYLLEDGGAERISVETYTNLWFEEAMQALIHGTAYQYEMVYRRDEALAAAAQGRYTDALAVLKQSDSTWITPPQIRISLGWPRRSW